MLVSAVDKLAEFLSSGEEQVNKNMAIEDILVHGRLLKEFFYREDRLKEDDARPIDFISNYSKWEQERPRETHWMKKIEERANKEIMHLTYTRHYGVVETKKWCCGTIRADFLEVVKVFLQNIDKKYWNCGLAEIRDI